MRINTLLALGLSFFLTAQATLAIELTETKAPMTSDDVSTCGDNAEEIKRLKDKLKNLVLQTLGGAAAKLAGQEGDLKDAAKKAQDLVKEADALAAEGKDDEASAKYGEAETLLEPIYEKLDIKYNLTAATARRRLATRFTELYDTLSAFEQTALRIALGGSGYYHTRLLLSLVDNSSLADIRKLSDELKALEAANCGASERDAWDDFIQAICDEFDALTHEGDEEVAEENPTEIPPEEGSVEPPTEEAPPAETSEPEGEGGTESAPEAIPSEPNPDEPTYEE